MLGWCAVGPPAYGTHDHSSEIREMTNARMPGDPGADGQRAASAAAGRDLGFWQRNPGLIPPMGLLVPLVLLAVLIYLVNPVFLDSRNLFNVFRQIAIFLVLGWPISSWGPTRYADSPIASSGSARAGCSVSRSRDSSRWWCCCWLCT